MKIKVNTSYNDFNNTSYYNMFEVVGELPTIEKIEDLIESKQDGYYLINEVSKDVEQPSPDVWDYDCYEVYYFNYELYALEDSIDEASEKKLIAVENAIIEEDISDNMMPCDCTGYCSGVTCSNFYKCYN